MSVVKLASVEISVEIGADGEAVAQRAAEWVMAALRERPAATIALAAGRTPARLYALLVAAVSARQLDLSQVQVFNLDEWVGLPADDPASCRSCLCRTLLDPAGIPPAHRHFLAGDQPDLLQECRRYEAEIRASGGLDLVILGIGQNGHLAFNEPGPRVIANTHVHRLTEQTRRAQVDTFGSIRRVPVQGITMGMGTILRGRRLLLLAVGAHKARAVAKAVHGPVITRVPASLLQLHRDVTWVVDQAAGRYLLPHPSP